MPNRNIVNNIMSNQKLAKNISKKLLKIGLDYFNDFLSTFSPPQSRSYNRFILIVNQRWPMKTNISIIGAGLNGLMCAINLARRGMTVEVFEKRTHQEICAPKYNLNGKIGRSMSMDLSTRGIHALKAINVFNEIEKKSVPMFNKIFHLSDNSLSTFPYGRHQDENILTISRTHLYQTLYQACLKIPNITINFGHILFDIDVSLRVLHFLVPEQKKECTISTDLVIGADGVNSKVRELIEKHTHKPFKKNLYSHSYKELSIPKHKNSALDHEAMHLWPREEFMLVAQPNFDGSFTCALLLKNSDEQYSFKELTPETIEDFFALNFSDALPFMPHLVSEFKENPVGNLYTISGSDWTTHDFVLILGDAAHGMVPFFGQGINCGFEDCTVLMDILDNTQYNWPLSLQLFNKQRVVDANAISAMSSVNYPELLDNPNLDIIMKEKHIELLLSREFGDLYRTYHNLVCFDRVPYAQIEKIRALQVKILSQLAKSSGPVQEIDRNKVVHLLSHYRHDLDETLWQ